MSAVSPPSYARLPPPFSAPHVPREYAGNIPPCAETLPILVELFDLLKHDWIRNFLFTSDPIQVTVLTSLSAAFAVNVVFKESSIGRDMSSTETFSATVDGETVLVPAFTNGPYTAGIGIKKRTSDIPENVKLMPWTGQLTTEHLRFIADTTTGRYFVIIRRYNFESFPLVVHNALAMLQVITETRECNVCGSALEPRCRCVLNTIKPSTPLDFEAMKKNLSSHFGAFQGAEALYLYTSGAQIASAELGARFSVFVGTDPKRTQALIHWAINDRMVAECPGPLRQLTPVSDDEAEELFGYCGDLDKLEEEESAINDIFKAVAESDSRKRERRSSSPNACNGVVKSLTEASEGSGDTPDNPSTPSPESDRRDPIIVHKDPEKLAKMRLRREKNREAARRSNFTKKLKNDQIRQQLAEETKKKNELQAREAALRLENSRLRKLASSSA